MTNLVDRIVRSKDLRISIVLDYSSNLYKFIKKISLVKIYCKFHPSNLDNNISIKKK